MLDYQSIDKKEVIKNFKKVIGKRCEIKNKDEWFSLNAEMNGFDVYEKKDEFVFDMPLRDLSIHILKDGSGSTQKGGKELDLSMHQALHDMTGLYLSEEVLKDIIKYEDENNIRIGVLHTYK